MHLSRQALAVALALSLTSCFSIITRVEAHASPFEEHAYTVYPGTLNFGDFFPKDTRLGHPWIPVVAVLDYPVGLVFDTLALPYDLYRLWSR